MDLTTETVLEYLPAFGYQPDPEKDTIMMRHALERVIERALAFTNQCTLPKGLKYEIINMAVGEFLFLKKATGGLRDREDGDGIVFPDIVKQFTEGDTNVSANAQGKNDEANFEKMVDDMRFGNPYILEHYRRLHW